MTRHRILCRIFILVLIAIVMCVVSAGMGAAATIIVDSGGGADYLNIQDAIDNANVGDTIEVRSGTYYEHVDINKQQILWGVDTGSGKPVVDASGSGSAITLSADGIILNGFTATNAGGDGIDVISNNNMLFNNNALNNNNGGIGLSASSNNTLSNNTISNNNYHGINLRYLSNNNTVTNNTISNNNYHGIYLSGSNNNMLSSNIFVNDGLAVYDSYNNSIVHNTVNNKTLVYLENKADIIIRNAGQVILVNSSNITVSDLNFSNVSMGIELWDTTDSKIINNTVSSNSYYLYDYGIYLYSSSNNTLSGNNALNNNNGIILLSSSRNNVLSNNTASNNNNGIYLGSSSNNTLNNNTASNNSDNGIFLISSGNNTLLSNTVSNSNYGIKLQSSSNNNTLNNNIVLSNSNYGIYLKSSSANNTLINNIAMNNFWGIYLDSSGANILTNNSVTNGGIRLLSSSNNILNNNTVLSSGNGIELYYLSTNNILTNNTVTSNRGTGIQLTVSSNNILTNNIALNNGGGFTLFGSNDNILNNNIASNNSGGFGISGSSSNIYISSNNILTNNTASNNSGGGITLQYTSGNTLSSNTVLNNGFGMFLLDSINNVINNNKFNNTQNIAFSVMIYPNYWNTTKTSSTNIIDGPYLSGNFWANPSGTGFSQTCIDTDIDGICDGIYTLESQNIDYLPLAAPDTTKPIITILSPIQNDNYNTDSANLNYAVSELTISEWYSLDDGNNISLSGNTTLSNLPDGYHNITVYANDSAGNVGSAIVNFTIDTIAPTVIIGTPQELNNYTTSTVALNVSADETIVSWQYSINGSTNTTFTPNTTLPSLPDGNHNVTVFANDSAENMGSTLVNFTIDTMLPTAPSNLIHTDDATSGYDNDHSIEFTWDASTDAQSSIIYRIYRNGVLNASTTSTTYTLAGETEGSHTYNVSAQDSTGNMNATNASVSVIVDYTNPVIHNLSLSDTTPRYKQQIIVNVNVTDTNIANVTAGGTLLTHQSGALWNGTIIAEHGANTVTVIAYDGANNNVTNSSLSYTGHASPKNNRGGGSNTGGTIGIISPETQVDDDDNNSDNDDDGDIAPFIKDNKDDDGKSKIPVNTPEDDETTFKTSEPNANGFLAKLPGFELILAIFGMLAMAGYMKRRT